MIKILASKRGQIGVFASVWDGIKSGIDWCFQTVPRPVLYMIFMILLVLLANSILPFFFNMTGTFCIEEKEYKNSAFDFFGNLGTTLALKSIENSRNYNISGVLDVEAGVTGCYFGFLNFTNITQFFYAGGFCTDCETITKDDSEYIKLGFTTNNLGLCKKDAYRLSEENKTFVQRVLCESIGDTSFIAFNCEPPVNFYYNQHYASYICLNPNICGNITPINQFIQKIEKKGFTRVIHTGDKGMFGISCFGNRAKIAVFGIDVFNYTLWIFITLACIIIWGISTFKKDD